MTAWRDNDKLFFAEARKGHKWEQHIAAQLAAAGLDVTVGALTFRESIEKAHEYLDQQDVYVTSPGGLRLLVECKSRDLSFTTPGTFPYEDIMVDTLSSWEAKSTKPDFYLCASQRTGSIIVLPGSTRDLWGERRTFDRVRKIWDVWLTADREMWYTIDDFVEGLLVS